MPNTRRTRYAFGESALGPDGRIDLSTVGPAVRSTALAAEHMVARREAKDISLAWVQTEYFGLLEDLLGNYRTAMDKRGMTPTKLASSVIADEQMSRQVIDSLERVASAFGRLWDQYQFVVDTHLEDMEHTKAAYGGDVFAQYESNTVTCASLLVDTIILPDPVDRATNDLRESIRTSKVVYQLVKHGLTMLSLRDLAFAEVEAPIIVASAGNLISDDTFARQWTVDAAAEDALFHLNSALEARFTSLEEVEHHLNKLAKEGGLDESVKDVNRLLGDEDLVGSLTSRVQQLQQLQAEITAATMPTTVGGTIVLNACARMLQTNALVRRCSQFDGLPLIDAPRSWQWMSWKFEYDHARGQATTEGAGEVKVANALPNQFSKESKYLSRLTPQAIVQLREAGVAEKFRNRLRDGVSEVLNADQSDIEAVGAVLIANLRTAFEEYEEELKKVLEAKSQLWTGIPWFMANATLAFAGPLTGNYALSLLAAGSGLLGPPSTKDLWKAGRKVVGEGAKLRRTPIGILVNAG